MVVMLRMKQIIKRCAAVISVIIILLCVALPCLAASLKGTATIKLEDKNKKPIDGVNIHICKIIGINSKGYFPAEGFESSGISVSGIISSPNEANAKKVKEYVMKNDIPTLSKTSKDGKATFDSLDLGIWLVFCDKDGGYTFNPYFIFIPYSVEGEPNYEIESFPKAEEISPDKISIYVIKKWDDKNNAAKKRPQAVKVELYDGKNAVSEISLSEANGWAHTFTDLPSGKNYSVKEQAVKNYSAHYSGDAQNGFIITNSYSGEKLPQTGQYWWPVVVLSIAGIGFIILGIVELGVRKNEKKGK